jgi:reverse transcriptase-like protein
MSSVDDARRPIRPPRFVLVPKPGGGERKLTVLHPIDDAAYRRVVSRLSGMLERVLGAQVLAHRVASVAPFRLRAWKAERAAFERRRRALGERANVVVKADVRDCYPSIRPEVAEAAFVRIGSGRTDAEALRRMLERFGDAGIRGLPVGPVASAVVANAVLTAVDDAVRASSAPHVRWVDDVWAASRDERHAAEIIDRIREALDAIGLSVHPGKTTVVDKAASLSLASSSLDEGSR